MTEPLFLSGSGVGGAGVLEVVGNNFLSLTSVTLDNPSALNVDSGCGATINNAISGNGPLTKIGNGFLQFAGSGNNSYAGDTIVAEGDLNLAKNAFVISVPQNLVVGPASAGSSATARWFQAGGLGGSTVTVNANSLLDLNGNNVNLNLLNLNDGGNVQTRGGTLNLNDGSSINVGSLSPFGSHVASTISGNLGLPIGSTTINVAPHASTPPLLSGPELDIPATISGGSSIQLTVVNKYGAGQLQLDGNNTYASQTRIYEGTLIAAFGGALGSSAVGTYVYNGASLALDNGINVTAELVVLDSTNFAALDSRNGANGWGGEIYLNRDTRINVNNSLIATGVIDGPGSLIKVGLGSLNLSGAPNNTFTGEAFVNQGTLLLNKPAAVTAIPGALEIGSDSGGFSATARNLSSYQIVGNIYVHSTGLYDINGQQENTDALVMYGNGTVQTGAGYLSLKTGAPVFVYPGTNTTATINGSIVMDPGNHLFMVNNGTAIPGVQDVVVNAVMSQISTASSIQKEGAGRMRLTANNTYAGGTAVNAGQLQVDGSQPQSAVTLSNATLQGSGTVGAINITGTSGIIAPGAGLGILTCANFNPGAGGSATLQLELNGTLPGFGHDQLNAQGTVRLTGVKLSPSLGFASSVNDQFTIINNDGSDAVVGTFTGLPQGTNFYISGELFQINYSGGTGNDVVLTRLVTPPKPALTIERVPPKSVRLLWTTNDSAYVLQSESDLAAMNWAVVPTPPVILGNNYVITNVVAGQSKFYRLAK
jgi:autotransporter-associated beta strand protein